MGAALAISMQENPPAALAAKAAVAFRMSRRSQPFAITASTPSPPAIAAGRPRVGQNGRNGISFFGGLEEERRRADRDAGNVLPLTRAGSSYPSASRNA